MNISTPDRGRTLREDLSMILRGIREFHTILPGQMRLVMLHAVLISLQPYITIFISAQIITELTGAMNVERLVLHVLLTISLTLIVTVSAARLQARIAVGYSQLFTAHEIRLNQKAYDLPYTLLEDETIRALRDQVSGSIDTSGAGMASLYWDMEVVAKSLSSAAIAAFLCSHALWVDTAREFSGVFAIANSPWVALLLAALIVLCAVVSSKQTSKLFDVIFEVFVHGAKYNRYANFYKLDYLSDDRFAKDVRIFAQKELIVEETQKRCYIPFNEGDKREKRASNRYNGVKLLLNALVGGAIYLLIGLKALSGTINIGSVVMTYGAVTMLIHALADFSMIFTDLRNNNEHLSRYFSYISLPNLKDAGKLVPAREESLHICFENVSYKYPWMDTFALRDVSFTLPRGKRLAIVGMNGSGKTTLVKLLCRLHEPTNGSITLDGQPIEDYKYEAYTELFSVVFQDFRLLSYGIGQNVAAATTYDRKRVEECLRKAGLGAKLDGLSLGVEQILYRDYEEEGISLSGGEEQKLAIARAMYKDAPIVVLDEPTAALDPLSEFEIYSKFSEIVGTKTTVFISHRLSSCRFCDVIAVMDQGRIVQWGSHDELVDQDGRYRELWNAQAQHYTGTSNLAAQKLE